MKKKISSEVLLDPDDYWEKKLNINYETEFIRYKKLCTRKLSKKENRKIDGIYYITYSAWEQKMIATISPLDESELYEYIHFLNGLTNNSSIFINLTSVILFPFMFGCFCPYIPNLIGEVFIKKNRSMLEIALGVIIGFFICFRMMIINIKDDSLHRSFYADLTHIAKNHYENIKGAQGAKHT